MEIHSSIDSSEELMHYGRKGMKWYQNIFSKDKGGSGKKGKSDEDDDDGQKSKGSSSSSSSSSDKPKSLRDMTNNEITAATERMRIEKTYLELQSEYAAALAKRYDELNPKKVSKGKEFTSKFKDKLVDDALIPATTDIVKQVFKSTFALGVNKFMEKNGVSEDYKIYTNNKKKDK